MSSLTGRSLARTGRNCYQARTSSARCTRSTARNRYKHSSKRNTNYNNTPHQFFVRSRRHMGSGRAPTAPKSRPNPHGNTFALIRARSQRAERFSRTSRNSRSNQQAERVESLGFFEWIKRALGFAEQQIIKKNHRFIPGRENCTRITQRAKPKSSTKTKGEREAEHGVKDKGRDKPQSKAEHNVKDKGKSKAQSTTKLQAKDKGKGKASSKAELKAKGKANVKTHLPNPSTIKADLIINLSKFTKHQLARYLLGGYISWKAIGEKCFDKAMDHLVETLIIQPYREQLNDYIQDYQELVNAAYGFLAEDFKAIDWGKKVLEQYPDNPQLRNDISEAQQNLHELINTHAKENPEVMAQIVQVAAQVYQQLEKPMQKELEELLSSSNTPTPKQIEEVFNLLPQDIKLDTVQYIIKCQKELMIQMKNGVDLLEDQGIQGLIFCDAYFANVLIHWAKMPFLPGVLCPIEEGETSDAWKKRMEKVRSDWNEVNQFHYTPYYSQVFGDSAIQAANFMMSLPGESTIPTVDEFWDTFPTLMAIAFVANDAGEEEQMINSYLHMFMETQDWQSTDQSIQDEIMDRWVELIAPDFHIEFI